MTFWSVDFNCRRPSVRVCQRRILQQFEFLIGSDCFIQWHRWMFRKVLQWVFTGACHFTPLYVCTRVCVCLCVCLCVCVCVCVTCDSLSETGRPMTPFGCSDHMAVSHTLADAVVVKSFLIFLRVGFFRIRFIFLIYERLFVFNASAVRRRRVLVCLALVFPLPLWR